MDNPICHPVKRGSRGEIRCYPFLLSEASPGQLLPLIAECSERTELPKIAEAIVWWLLRAKDCEAKNGRFAMNEIAAALSENDDSPSSENDDSPSPPSPNPQQSKNSGAWGFQGGRGGGGGGIRKKAWSQAESLLSEDDIETVFACSDVIKEKKCSFADILGVRAATDYCRRYVQTLPLPPKKHAVEKDKCN